MREVCTEKNRLTQIFFPVSEVLRSSRWSLDQGQKGYFREFVCDLDTFESFADKLADRGHLLLDAYAAWIWLDKFRKTYGCELKVRDNDGWHAATLAHGLRRDYPEKAEGITSLYRESLAAGTIHIAWDLYTIDFVKVRVFVYGLLDHPAVVWRKIKNMGWGMVNFPGKDAMRRALNCAINLVLAKK